MKISTTLLRCLVAAASIGALAAPTPAQAADTIGPGWASLANLEHLGYLESRLFPAGDGDLVAVLVKPGWTPTNAAAVYDGATNSWGPAIQSPQVHGHFFGATQLADGRVMVVGGYSNSRNATLFDPQLQVWTPTTPLPQGTRYDPVALADGRVLARGYSDGSEWAAVYDPVTEIWTPTAAPPRSLVDGVALADGRAAFSTVSNTGQLLFWSPDEGSWSEAPSIPSSPASTFYDGIVSTGNSLVALVSPAEDLESWRLDTTEGTWTRMGNLRSQPYASPILTALPGGGVLAVGANSFFSSAEEMRLNKTAQLLDPATGAWTPTGALTASHPDSSLAVADGKAYILQSRSETKALEVLDLAGPHLTSVPTVVLSPSTTPDRQYKGDKLVDVEVFDVTSFMIYPGVPLHIDVLPGGATPARTITDCDGPCTTGTSGKATFRVSNQLAAGVDTLRVHADFDGDGAVNGDEPVGTGTVTWERRTTYLALDSPATLDLRLPLSVRARITYVGGCDRSNSYGSGCSGVYQPLAGRLVTFYAASDPATPLCRARSGANGYAQCGFYVERVKAIAAGVRAVFPGDALYDASSSSARGVR